MLDKDRFHRILGLALPLIGGMISQNILNLVDTAMVSRLDDSNAALAAVGYGGFMLFMAQAGTMVICGDAGHHLGDSLYEATLYVHGSIASLGADACEQPMEPEDLQRVATLLEKAELEYDPASFKRIGSARQLYHWNADAGQEY